LRPDERFHAEMRRDAERARKRRDFEIWSRAVERWAANSLPRAVIKVRQDDRSILELFAGRFGVGAVGDQRAYANPNPSSTWMICATDQLAPAVGLFEDAQLRGRKRREFEVWCDAAHERAVARVVGRRWDRARVADAAERLTALRA
jgi:hypothetical protein